MDTRNDWYRKETWSASDAADFESRLKGTRGQRTQYLKLQAWHLAQTRKPDLVAPAIDLANRYLNEDPSGFFEVQAYLIIADASNTKGDTAGALQAYKSAVKAEGCNRGLRCYAYLDYAWFVATNGLSSEFGAALKSMELMEEGDLAFPISQYRYFAALALIAAELKDPIYASRMAKNAVEAEARTAPFTRHSDLGLVAGINSSIRSRVRQLAIDGQAMPNIRSSGRAVNKVLAELLRRAAQLWR